MNDTHRLFVAGGMFGVTTMAFAVGVVETLVAMVVAVVTYHAMGASASLRAGQAIRALRKFEQRERRQAGKLADRERPRSATLFRDELDETSEEQLAVGGW